MAKLHAGMVAGGTCFMALEQTAGKGQRGRTWIVEPGVNITMTTVLQPPVYERFLYSAVMALACYDFIKGFGINEVSVKWPNDIYIGDRKAAGILIENIQQGTHWQWAVAGTGINLNQLEFPADLSRAISVAQATGRQHDLISSARILHLHILRRNEWAKVASAAEIMNEYNTVLYRRNESVRLKKDAAVFSTVIKEVTASGELITYDTMERRFTVGEVEFIG
ncbi:MAG: biotin--[acetyl-CoA-carboxylase] ligase [Chitinophagaceae bacterium]|nr:biotin--[acetyl-CoA-carboxylase] ligase [Chitinophagaceae bacterium]